MEEGETTRRRVVFEPEADAELVLRVVSSPDSAAIEQARRIDTHRVAVGRSIEGGWNLADPTLSRRHFQIRPDAKAPLLVDLGATNPSFVDGRRVSGEVALRAGSVVTAGDSVFVVERRASDDGLLIAHDVSGDGATDFIGQSWAAARVRRALETAATSEGPVLLLGPTGAGKEVSARIVHALSGRRGGFVPINCAAIPSELAESTLFGHVKGAFTGADRARDGAFVEAEGGTLFLDELAELPAALQAKLLRVLQDGVVQPVGGRPRQVDARIVAATLKDVARGDDFRRDLYARLAHWVVPIPPLSERRADVIPLFRSFAGDLATTADFDACLVAWSWPGNVRELAKLASRLRRLAPPGRPLGRGDLPPQMRTAPADGPSSASAGAERRAEPPTEAELSDALRAHGGNINRTARAHGWHRMQVYRWMQGHGLDPDDFR